MPLGGTFDVLDIAEVLRLLARFSSTGRLHIRTGTMQAAVWLVGGDAVGAETTNGASNGYGSDRHSWRGLLEDVCFEALRTGRGSFGFEPDDDPDARPGPAVKLEGFVAAGRQRLDEWRQVEATIRSFEAVPRLAEGLRAESMNLDRERWRVLVAIDGRRNVAGLARRLDVDVLRVCQLLKPLVDDGAVVMDVAETRAKAIRARPGTEEPSAAPATGAPEPAGGNGVATRKPPGRARAGPEGEAPPASLTSRLRGRRSRLPAGAAGGS